MSAGEAKKLSSPGALREYDTTAGVSYADKTFFWYDSKREKSVNLYSREKNAANLFDYSNESKISYRNFATHSDPSKNIFFFIFIKLNSCPITHTHTRTHADQQRSHHFQIFMWFIGHSLSYYPTVSDSGKTLVGSAASLVAEFYSPADRWIINCVIMINIKVTFARRLPSKELKKLSAERIDPDNDNIIK